jgi:two-component system chemotaxis response regulator CheB
LTEPDDKEPIERSHVYVAPADYHLIVERGFFALSVDPPVFFSRPSIDVMFESIADSYGAAAVAVMLTCANEDGAAGARAVKNAGGRVLVQDPSTAESAVAPRAVLASVTVDGVHDIEGLAARLVELAG